MIEEPVHQSAIEVEDFSNEEDPAHAKLHVEAGLAIKKLIDDGELDHSCWVNILTDCIGSLAVSLDADDEVRDGVAARLPRAIEGVRALVASQGGKRG